MLRREKCFRSPSYSRQDSVWANKIVCKLLKWVSNGYYSYQILESFSYWNILTPRRRACRVVDLKVPYTPSEQLDLPSRCSTKQWIYDVYSDASSYWHFIGQYTCLQLAFLTPCNQAFNPPFLGGKIIELAKFCFKNKSFEPSLSFFSKQVIVSHCV